MLNSYAVTSAYEIGWTYKQRGNDCKHLQLASSPSITCNRYVPLHVESTTFGRRFPSLSRSLVTTHGPCGQFHLVIHYINREKLTVIQM